MAAKNKSELLVTTQREFEKLGALIRPIETDVAMEKMDGDTSIKDVIGHRAHWIELFLGWYANGLAGQDVHFPAEGYKWNDLKRYNADLREAQSDLGWPNAVALLDTNYAKLMTFLNGCTEAELYGGPMKGANNAWTPGRWAEAAGSSHFRSASKYVRASLKQLRSA